MVVTLIVFEWFDSEVPASVVTVKLWGEPIARPVIDAVVPVYVPTFVPLS